MATSEAAAKITEHVNAAMVDCTPPEEVLVTAPLPEPPEESPVQHSSSATIEHVGADPPPEG